MKESARRVRARARPPPKPPFAEPNGKNRDGRCFHDPKGHITLHIRNDSDGEKIVSAQSVSGTSGGGREGWRGGGGDDPRWGRGGGG